MDKRKLITELENYLREERAGAAPERVTEIDRLLLMYRFLPVRAHAEGDIIAPSTLVQLKLGAQVAYYFVVPQGGGLVTSVDGLPVQVITPESPLGGALLGHKPGDTVAVEIRGQRREYEVMGIY